MVEGQGRYMSFGLGRVLLGAVYYIASLNETLKLVEMNECGS